MYNQIHLCVAADNNYKLPLATLVNSFIKSNQSLNTVIHVLCSGLSVKYQNKLKSKCQNTNISIDFIDMSNYDFDFHGLDMQHWTKAIFYRIMIPELFKDLDRIIYIDGDTLIMGDLADLFNTDMGDDYMLAMVVDRFSYKTRIGELGLSNYFNSGMILFDIKKCREFDFSAKSIQWIHDHSDIAKFPDQDAINSICDKKILRLNNMYNKQFATTDLIDWEKKPVIAHFLSAIKPWMKTSPLGYAKVYRSYIPTTRQHTIVYLSQILYSSKYFFFHKQYTMTMTNMNIVEQIKYYLFNIHIYTKTLKNGNNNLIDVLKNNKEARKCL